MKERLWESTAHKENGFSFRELSVQTDLSQLADDTEQYDFKCS